MKKIVRLTESELVKLVKKVLIEQTDPSQYHRYDEGANSPGIEKFFQNPSDQTVESGLKAELERDKYGKGKIVVRLNGQKFDRPGEFILSVQNLQQQKGLCYQIENYEYKNRKGAFGADLGVLNSQINIIAKQVSCKKQEQTQSPVKPPVKPQTPIQDTPVKPPVKPKAKCRYPIKFPGLDQLAIRSPAKDIKSFQSFCNTINIWQRDLNDGTSTKCSTKDIDGIWGCCSQTCYQNLRIVKR